ncbi:MAG: hypothetical protein M3277_11110 [Actinomycetota bacterium]|nr:hypothetical protein [Actinomycetota bacterium]
MSLRSRARIALVIALVCGSVVAASNPAHALFHLMMVTEVLAGTSTAPDAQFIEMQMYAENQRFLAGHEVAVFDAAGTEIAAFTFTGPVANGANQSHVLLATEQAESEFGVEADLVMTPVLTAGGGSVCFRSADGGIIDCAAWGNYSGDKAETGTPFNPTLGLIPGQSMQRVTGGGSDPEALDADDDTNDSEADFDSSSPNPTNNAGEGTEPEPEPETVDHERSVSLSLRRALIAKGTVRAEGDYEPCFREVAVRIQRNSGGTWRTVARTTTAGDGDYRAQLRDRPGRYRAVAPKFSPMEGHGCLKATSPVRRNG